MPIWIVNVPGSFLGLIDFYFNPRGGLYPAALGLMTMAPEASGFIINWNELTTDANLRG